MAGVVGRLTTKDSGGLPEDAAFLTLPEVMEKQAKMLAKWQPRSDLAAFDKGVPFMVGGTALGGVFILNHYRRAFRLGASGRLISYAAIIGMPSLCNMLFYHATTYTSLLVGRHLQCPICLPIKNGLQQVAWGTLYPVTLSSVMGFYYALVSASEAIPQLHFPLDRAGVTSHAKAVANIWLQKTRPIAWPLTMLAALQMLGGMAVLHRQQDAMNYVHNELNRRIDHAKSKGLVEIKDSKENSHLQT